MSIDAFSQFFSDIKDPRQSAKVSYPLFDVLFLTICATIAGDEGWEDIEDFGDVHLEWFQEKGLFKGGLPVHDTINVFRALNQTNFSNALSTGCRLSVNALKANLSPLMAKYCVVHMTVKTGSLRFTWSVHLPQPMVWFLDNLKRMKVE